MGILGVYNYAPVCVFFNTFWVVVQKTVENYGRYHYST